MRIHHKEKIEQTEHRELARTDPWRGIWMNSQDVEAIFNRRASELTSEQQQLVGWARLYDSLSEAHEPPAQGVIGDDDALDGWLSKQKRKRENEQNKFKLDGFDENHQGSDEVYIMAHSPEEANEIHNLNDPYSKMIKQNRRKKVAIKGEKGKGMDYYKFDDVKIRKLNQENMKGGNI